MKKRAQAMKMIPVYVFFLSLFWGANCASAEAIAVVVNRANMVDNLSIEQLVRIYEGIQRQWPDGKQIIAVNRPADSTVRKVFYRQVLSSKPTRKFRLPGRRIPFRSIIQKSSLATIRFVNNLPEAIGYLFLSELELDEENKDIKLIMVIGIEADHEKPGEEK